MKSVLAAIALAMAGLVGPGAAAVTIVDTGNSGAVNGFTLQTGNQLLATQFTLDKSYTSISFEIFGRSFDNSSEATFSIASDAAGLPGVSLATTTFILTSTQSWQGASFGNLNFGPGTYWLAGGAEDLSVWNGPAAKGNLSAYTRGDSNWMKDTGTRLTLRLSGDVAAAVPEPATWGMMILGFSMVGYAMRRRKVTFARA